MDQEQQKELIKQALKEWLDEKWAQFGKWSMRGIAAMAIVGVTYLFLRAHGWNP